MSFVGPALASSVASSPASSSVPVAAVASAYSSLAAGSFPANISYSFFSTAAYASSIPACSSGGAGLSAGAKKT